MCYNMKLRSLKNPYFSPKCLYSLILSFFLMDKNENLDVKSFLRKFLSGHLLIYIIKQDSHILFPIVGQTAGPIGLNFFVDTQGWSGGDIG